MYHRSFFKLLAAIFVSSLSGCSTNEQEVTPPPPSKEITLSIIKPDAVQNNHIGSIIARFEKNDLRIAGIKMVKLNEQEAGNFYKVHKGRPFYNELIKFMASGPIIVMVLEGDNAIQKNREIMGATDPEKAASDTIRKDFAASISQNAVHGSDSSEAAMSEVRFFFKPEEIKNRY